MVTNNNNFCIIDIGTNSCKCLLHKDSKSIIVSSRPSKSQDFIGNNKDDVDVDTIMRNVIGFCASAVDIDGINAQNIKIIATEGLRKAPNKNELLNKFNEYSQKKLHSQTVIEIASPTREAALAIRGILATTKPETNTAIIIESGGASTEVSYIEKVENSFKILTTQSIPLGNTNINTNNIKQSVKEKITALNIKDIGSAEVIINADSAFHIMAKYHNKENWLQTEGLSMISFDFVENLENIAKNKKSKGFERCILLKEIITQLNVDEYAKITTSLCGVKEGLLEESIKSQNKQKQKQLEHIKRKRTKDIFSNQTIIKSLLDIQR